MQESMEQLKQTQRVVEGVESDQYGNRSNEEDEAESFLSAGVFMMIQILAFYFLVIVRGRLHRKVADYTTTQQSYLVFGLLFSLIAVALNFHESASALVFDPTTFIHVFLPPVLFYTGYSLNIRLLLSNFGGVMLFGLCGTGLTFVATWGLVHALAVGGVIAIKAAEAPLYAAIVTAIDPIASIEALHVLHVSPDLMAMLQGEAVLSEAFALPMFYAILDFYVEDDLVDSNAVIFFSILLYFLGYVILSLGLGVVSGALFCVALKYSRDLDRYPNCVVMLQIVWAYMSFAFGEGFGLSGNVALIATGAMMHNYGTLSMQQEAINTGKNVFSGLANLTETATMLMVGATPYIFIFEFDVIFMFFAVLIAVFLRLAIVALLALINNATRGVTSERRMDVAAYTVVSTASMRGAIPMALAFNLISPNNEHVLSAVIAVVFFTSAIIGPVMYSLFRSLRLPHSKVVEARLAESLQDAAVYQRWNNFNIKYLQGFLSSMPYEERLARDQTAKMVTVMFRMPSRNDHASLDSLVDPSLGGGDDAERRETGELDDDQEAELRANLPATFRIEKKAAHRADKFKKEEAVTTPVLGARRAGRSKPVSDT